ncbi:unnamed protein product [Cutaneotrichosporon oleaginosum]
MPPRFRTHSYSPRPIPVDGVTMDTTQRHRTASPFVRDARLVPPVQLCRSSFRVRFSRLTPDTAFVSSSSVLSSTISGHVIDEPAEPETVKVEVTEDCATDPAPPRAAAPQASQYVRAFDATTFQEAFAFDAKTEGQRGKGGDKLFQEECDNPEISSDHADADVPRPRTLPPIAITCLDPRVRECWRKWPKEARLERYVSTINAKKRSYDRVVIGSMRARAGWYRAARKEASLIKFQLIARRQAKALRRFAASEGANLTMEWDAPPSPVQVIEPHIGVDKQPAKGSEFEQSPTLPAHKEATEATGRTSLVRLKLQLVLERARADASERALRDLAPIIKDIGVPIPDTFAHLLQ